MELSRKRSGPKSAVNLVKLDSKGQNQTAGNRGLIILGSKNDPAAGMGAGV
jgi:hypothetical protein